MFPIFPLDLNSLALVFPWVNLVFHTIGAQFLSYSSPGLWGTPGCVALHMMLMVWTQCLDHGSQVALM